MEIPSGYLADIIGRRKTLILGALFMPVGIGVYVFTHPRLRWLMLFGALIRSTGVVGVWAYFLYYESIGIGIAYFGVLFAGWQLSSAFGSKYAHNLERKMGRSRSVYLVLLIAPAFLLLGLFKSPLILPLIFCSAFLFGLSFPLILDRMNRLIGSEVRATALSVANMTGSFSFVIVSPLFGKLVDVYSLSGAFVIMGMFFILCGSISAVKIARNFR